ncbi:40S ribosomal protein S4 [Camelus dromedarius]|uniref:40S ribosomal protein S4 n=1 Tax=Camelus dromedarius TaxID=9838 RepID=A0A5N4BWU9_CAMDR|nr:40S ribosomal protein S4 [Camelus dromedarius]
MSSALTRPERISTSAMTPRHFDVHCITPKEAKYKSYKVRKISVDTKGVSPLVTHDVYNNYYPDPVIKVNDTLQTNLETNQNTHLIKFDTGNLSMLTRSANLGRIRVITNRERSSGSFDTLHVKDAKDNKQPCHLPLQHFCYWQKQQAIDISSLRKSDPLHHC